MVLQVLHCSNCQGTDIVRHGMTRQGKQRYRCRQCLEGRGRTFLLEGRDPVFPVKMRNERGSLS
jgi:transposase-like protein